LCNNPKQGATSSLEVGGVEDDGHGDTTDGAGDGDGHDPGEDEETDSLPVDGLDSAVAETDTDGGTGDAHGCGDGEGVLREDQDSERGTHFHRATCEKLVYVMIECSVSETYLCWENGR
jgi:hypothetical protein